jgi:hypothetical protein
MALLPYLVKANWEAILMAWIMLSGSALRSLAFPK